MQQCYWRHCVWYRSVAWTEKFIFNFIFYAVYRALLSTNNCVKIYSGTSTVAKGEFKISKYGKLNGLSSLSYILKKKKIVSKRRSGSSHYKCWEPCFSLLKNLRRLIKYALDLRPGAKKKTGKRINRITQNVMKMRLTTVSQDVLSISCYRRLCIALHPARNLTSRTPWTVRRGFVGEWLEVFLLQFDDSLVPWVRCVQIAFPVLFTLSLVFIFIMNGI